MEVTKQQQLAEVRGDLQGLGMPYFAPGDLGGDNEPVGYYYGPEPVPYRWVDGDDGFEGYFQIQLEGVWYNAYSIDFDFLN